MADSGIGQPSDTKATNTTGAWSLVALTKYLTDQVAASATGDATAANQATQITAEQLTNTNLGGLTDTAVITDANGSINAHIRGILVEAIAQLAVQGTTSGAAVITDATGTLQQYLRGLVKLWIAGGLGVDTELSAAIAYADGLTKPTTAPVEAWLVGYNGTTGDMVRVQSFGVDLSAVTITTIATVWTPTSGKKFRLMGGSFSVSAACSVLFEDNSAGNGTIYRTPQLVAATPYNFDLGNGKLSAVANNVLKATASTGTVTITGTLRGTEE